MFYHEERAWMLPDRCTMYNYTHVAILHITGIIIILLVFMNWLGIYVFIDTLAVLCWQQPTWRHF